MKVVSDGLSVRSNPAIFSTSCIHLGFKHDLCKAYQLACQALCSDAPLHTRKDPTRHEAGNVMQYSTEAGSSKGKGKGKLVVYNNDNYEEGNGDEDARYDLEDFADTGLVRNEQAGVLHLVHGWIQQKQPEKVTLSVSL